MDSSEMGVDPMVCLLDGRRVAWSESDLLQAMASELDRVEYVFGLQRYVKFKTCAISLE
jgi:hypothetical protein